jgi:hypothetical protein
VLCARWNLVPFEQRLEAIDECERLFRIARARLSTGHIGLARINEHLELVRIGPALRPEFAAWRYGRTLRRRRLPGGVPASAEEGGLAGWLSAGFDRLARVMTLPVWDEQVAVRMALAGARVVRDPWTDRLVPVPVAAMAHAVLTLDRDLEWRLELPYRTELDALLGTDPLQLLSIRDHPTVGIFRGDAMFPTLGRTLPVFERHRPHADQVTEAIRMLELSWGDASGLLRYVSGQPLRFATQRSYPLVGIAPELRLALEMASHEETERRAMEGELKLLEREWREAESIAKHADALVTGDG